MPPPKPGPRVSAKAVILRSGRLLAIECHDAAGPWYLLPGGGQDRMEPLEAALRREVREEVSVEVIVHRPLFIRDYIGSNHEYAAEDGNFHQVEIMFLCDLADPAAEPALGATPDKTQQAAVWLPLDRLLDLRFYPRAMVAPLQALAPRIAAGARDLPAEYLGDVN
ncbi:MAG: NUDIX domain-containing protein [Planctomycetota bacterium]